MQKKGYRKFDMICDVVPVHDLVEVIIKTLDTRDPYTFKEGFIEVERGRKTQFCPDTADIFLNNRGLIIEAIEEADEEIGRYEQNAAEVV